MKISIRTTVLTGILSLLLFFTGSYFYEQFIDWTLPNIKGVSFLVTSIGGQFSKMLGLGLVLGLVPVCTVLIWKYAPVASPKRRMLSIVIVVVCVCLGAVLRQKWLMMEADMGVPNLGGNSQISLPLENFNVTNYMFYGLLVGVVISYFTLKQSVSKS